MKTAIAALIITGINSIAIYVLAVKNYRKSKRDTFNQRRDYFWRTMSDLSTKNAEGHLIAARFEMVAVKNTGLNLRDEEQIKTNAIIVASTKEASEAIRRGTESYDKAIEDLHNKYTILTEESDVDEIEKLIALVQINSDYLKQVNDRYQSQLHILESSNEYIVKRLAELDEKLKQINADFRQGMKDSGF